MRRLALILLAALGAACAGSGQQVRERGLRDTSPYEFHRAIASTLLRTGQAGQAIAHIRALQELRPKNPEPFFLMGSAYLQLDVPTSAREMFERALTLDPRLAAAHSAIGVLLDSQGEHRKAEAEHRQAIALRGNDARFENNLGFCLYLQGRWAEAAAAYERALALDAGLRRLHNNAGFAYGRLGELDRAYAHFRLAGTPAQAQNNMGLVYEGRGELEGAYQRYQAAVGADPSLREARTNLARVGARLGRSPEGAKR